MNRSIRFGNMSAFILNSLLNEMGLDHTLLIFDCTDGQKFYVDGMIAMYGATHPSRKFLIDPTVTGRQIRRVKRD